MIEGRSAGRRNVEILSPYVKRPHFQPLHRRASRWFIGITHRRAGKTVAHINELIIGALKSGLPEPRFAYIAPQLNQAKEIAWTYLKEYTAFVMGRRVNESELWVELPGGKRIRIYGADNPDRLRGIYLDGVVFDEFGDMHPAIWSMVVRPTLSDRAGWACFIGTPKGRNALHRLWEDAANDPAWTRLMLKASETGLLDAGELADARKAMTDDEYAQEFECSFDAAVRGAYYGKEMSQAEATGRIGPVPFDPHLPVHTAWDLGMADSTVIWFVQVHGGETRVIDVLKGEGEGLDWYAGRLEERPMLHGQPSGWLWGEHYLPHDAQVRELGTGKSRIEILADLGIHATLCPSLRVEDGIQAVRLLLPTCRFDAERCKKGIEALSLYRRKYDDKTEEYRSKPLHNWTSHYADAFRYFAVGHRPRPPARRIKRNTGWVV